MKKVIKKTFFALTVLVILFFCACQYNLTEDTFFLTMTNMQYYPQQYVGADISFDAFTYELTDINGEKHICVVRQCSAGYGCKCGKDTVIGFLIDFDGEIPAPKNQSEKNNDKTWVHVKGTLPHAEKTNFQIYAIDGTVETITFLTFKAETLDLIEEYSGLHYYVDK